jgi:hypothetical protein
MTVWPLLSQAEAGPATSSVASMATTRSRPVEIERWRFTRSRPPGTKCRGAASPRRGRGRGALAGLEPMTPKGPSSPPRWSYERCRERRNWPEMPRRSASHLRPVDWSGKPDSGSGKLGPRSPQRAPCADDPDRLRRVIGPVEEAVRRALASPGPGGARPCPGWRTDRSRPAGASGNAWRPAPRWRAARRQGRGVPGGPRCSRGNPRDPGLEPPPRTAIVRLRLGDALAGREFKPPFETGCPAPGGSERGDHGFESRTPHPGPWRMRIPGLAPAAPLPGALHSGIETSTRRLRARPWSVALSATGRDFPKPLGCSLAPSTPLFTSAATTARARRSERSRL